MAEAISSLRYPTTYRYVTGLPSGIKSYPEIQTLSELPHVVQAKYPEIAGRKDLPESIMEVVRVNFKAQRWVPEVHFMLLNALVRDIYFKDDENYGKFCFDTMKDSYSGPIMRSIMYVMSPSVLALASEKRWSSYKRGISLKCISSSPEGRVLSLEFPKGLYVQSMLLGMAKSIEAALSCTRTKTYSTAYEMATSQECRFLIKWTV